LIAEGTPEKAGEDAPSADLQMGSIMGTRALPTLTNLSKGVPAPSWPRILIEVPEA